MQLIPINEPSRSSHPFLVCSWNPRSDLFWRVAAADSPDTLPSASSLNHQPSYPEDNDLIHRAKDDSLSISNKSDWLSEERSRSKVAAHRLINHELVPDPLRRSMVSISTRLEMADAVHLYLH